MPEGGPWGYVALLIALILCNAIFAMSEIAVISFNDNKLKLLAEEGNRKAKTLRRLTSQPSRFLSTIQVGVTLAGMLSSAVAADTFTEYLVAWLKTVTPISVSLLKGVSLVVITLLLAFLNLVFGELVPKRIAMNNPEKVSFAVTGILSFVSVAFKPIVAMLSGTTNGILRLIGIDPDQQDNEVTEEEIRMMIDVGEEEGNIDLAEKAMLHNIFEFDDRTIDDVMTHRTEIVAIEKNAAIEDIIDLAVANGHSRLPVCDGGLDNITGILYIKDLLGMIVTRPANFAVDDYMRAVMYVPESSRCKDTFEELRRRKLQMAVVVDEYGGTAGIVTMEDILESIVGNIQDEFDHEPENIEQLADGEYLLAGSALLEEVEDRLDCRFTDAGDYDTIAGYIIDKLGRLPSADEVCEVRQGRYLFTVVGMEEHRISLVRAQLMPEEKDEERDS